MWPTGIDLLKTKSIIKREGERGSLRCPSQGRSCGGFKNGLSTFGLIREAEHLGVTWVTEIIFTRPVEHRSVRSQSQHSALHRLTFRTLPDQLIWIPLTRWSDRKRWILFDCCGSKGIDCFGLSWQGDYSWTKMIEWLDVPSPLISQTMHRGSCNGHKSKILWQLISPHFIPQNPLCISLGLGLSLFPFIQSVPIHGTFWVWHCHSGVGESHLAPKTDDCEVDETVKDECPLLSSTELLNMNR